MSSIKSSVGTPLDDVEALDQEARARLAALSVTTAEELLGLMKADPERTAEFLGVDNLTPLANDVGRVASGKRHARPLGGPGRRVFDRRGAAGGDQRGAGGSRGRGEAHRG